MIILEILIVWTIAASITIACLFMTIMFFNKKSRSFAALSCVLILLGLITLLNHMLKA